VLRTGFEPATDNRHRSGPQQEVVAVVRVQSVAESNRFCQITGSLRPATTAGPPGVEPGPARLELAVLLFTPRAFEKRTTRIEQASPGWKPGALPSELRPRIGTPGWSRTSVLCLRTAALVH
jgi:hypothetical protein